MVGFGNQKLDTLDIGESFEFDSEKDKNLDFQKQ